MHRQVIFFDKVKCVNIIQQNLKHHCKFASHVCFCQALAPRLSQEKVNFCQMVKRLPFHFFRRKNCTVPSGAKFSLVFPVKRKVPLYGLHCRRILFKNNMSEVKLIPEDFEADIPVHPANLGRWLRQNSVQEEVISILVGECVNLFLART